MAHICMILIGDIRYDGRVRKEIRTLVTAGHHIELIVSDFDKTGSGGEDLRVKIHYIPTTLWPSRARNFAEQLLFNRRAASIVKKLAPTHIHCHDLSTLLAGAWAKEQARAKLVFDAHELMPESMGGIREKIWGYIEKQCIKHCDCIVMPEKNRIAYFKRKYPDIPEPLLLENFPSKRDLPAENSDILRDIYSIKKGQSIILYSGNIAPARDIEELIDSMVLCNNEFVLVILGTTSESYKKTLYEKIKELNILDRVFIHNVVPHAEILQYMASCNIGIAIYRNINVNNYYCASNKLYEYIALGKIVLTNNYPGLLETVEKFNQGVCLREVNSKSLAEAYVYAKSTHINPGARKFFWEDQQDILIQLYS